VSKEQAAKKAEKDKKKKEQFAKRAEAAAKKAAAEQTRLEQEAAKHALEMTKKKMEVEEEEDQAEPNKLLFLENLPVQCNKMMLEMLFQQCVIYFSHFVCHIFFGVLPYFQFWPSGIRDTRKLAWSTASLELRLWSSKTKPKALLQKEACKDSKSRLKTFSRLRLLVNSQFDTQFFRICRLILNVLTTSPLYPRCPNQTFSRQSHRPFGAIFSAGDWRLRRPTD